MRPLFNALAFLLLATCASAGSSTPTAYERVRIQAMPPLNICSGANAAQAPIAPTGGESQATAGPTLGVDAGGPVYTTSWTSSGPLTQIVKTERKSGENAKNHMARHKAAVTAGLAAFPPTAPPPPPPSGLTGGSYFSTSWYHDWLDTPPWQITMLTQTATEPGMVTVGATPDQIAAAQAALHAEAVGLLLGNFPASSP